MTILVLKEKTWHQTAQRIRQMHPFYKLKEFIANQNSPHSSEIQILSNLIKNDELRST